MATNHNCTAVITRMFHGHSRMLTCSVSRESTSHQAFNLNLWTQPAADRYHGDLTPSSQWELNSNLLQFRHSTHIDEQSWRLQLRHVRVHVCVCVLPCQCPLAQAVRWLNTGGSEGSKWAEKQKNGQKGKTKWLMMSSSGSAFSTERIISPERLTELSDLSGKWQFYFFG